MNQVLTYIVSTEIRSKMEAPNAKRSKKSDKAKKTHEKNGNFSQKHVRLIEALAEKKKP
jgi:hypothetical protein